MCWFFSSSENVGWTDPRVESPESPAGSQEQVCLQVILDPEAFLF